MTQKVPDVQSYSRAGGMSAAEKAKTLKRLAGKSGQPIAPAPGGEALDPPIGPAPTLLTSEQQAIAAANRANRVLTRSATAATAGANVRRSLGKALYLHKAAKLEAGE